MRLLAMGLGALALSACGDSLALPNQPADSALPLCAFRGYVDAMLEPAPHDGPAVLRWAEAMQSYADHLRLDQLPPKKSVPQQVTMELGVIRRDASAYVRAVQAAHGDGGKLDAAFAGIAAPEFTRAVSDVYAWDVNNCADSNGSGNGGVNISFGGAG